MTFPCLRPFSMLFPAPGRSCGRSHVLCLFPDCSQGWLAFPRRLPIPGVVLCCSRLVLSSQAAPALVPSSWVAPMHVPSSKSFAGSFLAPGDTWLPFGAGPMSHRGWHSLHRLSPQRPPPGSQALSTQTLCFPLGVFGTAAGAV